MQTFNVQGMTCGHCVRAVTGVIVERAPNALVTVDLAASQVQVEASLDRDELVALIESEGYRVVAE